MDVYQQYRLYPGKLILSALPTYYLCNVASCFKLPFPPNTRPNPGSALSVFQPLLLMIVLACSFAS